MPIDAEDGAFDTAITNIYKAKSELSELKYDAQDDTISENIENLEETNRITGQIAANDINRITERGAESQGLFSHDIDTARTLGEKTSEAYDLNVAGLESARDYDLAGLDLELGRLGGQQGLIDSRYQKGQADLTSQSRTEELGAYSAALANAYSSGSGAGFAQQGDRQIAEQASLRQGTIGRESRLLGEEYSQASRDLSTQIGRIELGKGSTEAAYGNRIASTRQQQDIAATQTAASIERQGLLKNTDAAETKTQLERADLALQLENEQHANNVRLQEIAQALAEASKGHQTTILINERATLLAQNAFNQAQLDLYGG